MIQPHLGFYRTSGINFSSKVDALLYSQTQNNSKVSWHFNDRVFDHFDWTIEPNESLDELYDQRSRQLREKYDYIILSFSGGADTNNILESFYRQGLVIDEVVTNHMTRATSNITVLDPRVKDSWNFGAEHQLQAVPRLQWIKDNMPQTKITELDVSDSVINGIIHGYQDAEWVQRHNDHLSVGQLFRYNYWHFSELRKRFDSHQRVAIIVGADKPRCSIDEDNNFWLSFVDTVANITTINDFNKDNDNITTELFYWAGESASMICKQAHVIRHWLVANPQYQSAWQGVNFNKMRLIQERIMRPLLYTTWNDSWYQADKSTQWWHTEFDTWFHRQDELKQQRQQWQHGIDYLAKQLPQWIRLNPQGQPDSFVPFTKRYLVGKIENKILLS